MSKRKVLFFITGPVPTDADKALAAKLGTKMFRNAEQVVSGEKPESGTTHVAGAVPAAYRGVAGIEVLDESTVLPAIELPTGGTSGEEKPRERAADIINESSTIGAIKKALAAKGVTFRATAKKAELLELYNAE